MGKLGIRTRQAAPDHKTLRSKSSKNSLTFQKYPSLKVRRATLRDIKSLVHQRRAMWEEIKINHSLDWGDQIYRRWAQSRLKSGKLVAWVAETRTGDIVGGGCLWLQPIQPRPHLQNVILQPYMISMYTEKGFRGRGIGSMIVREAINWCRKNGYQRLTLTASPTGRSVYKSLGFRRTWEMRLDL